MFLIEAKAKNKKISVAFAFLARFMVIFVAIAGLITDNHFALDLIVMALMFRYLFSGIMSPAWSVWMHEFVPQNIMGGFFARRLLLMTFVSILTGLSIAKLVDVAMAYSSVAGTYVYALIFFVAFLAGMLSVYHIYKIPEKKYQPVPMNQGMRQLLILPFKDANFRHLIVFLSVWQFAVNLATPFFTVQMLKTLQLPLTTVIFLTILSQIFYILTIRVWGKIADKFGNKPVLSVCAPMLVLTIFAFIFTENSMGHNFLIWLLVAIHVVMGVANAGIALGVNNISLKLAPATGSSSYLAVVGFFNSFFAGVAPILGGLFADFFVSRELSVMFQWSSPIEDILISPLNFRNLDFFFLFAGIFGFFSLHLLDKVNEGEKISEKAVFKEFTAEAKHKLSSLEKMAFWSKNHIKP